jgi:drug/metabolite transporter (DMT)-like permease
MRQLGQQHLALSWRTFQGAATNPWILASLVLSVATYIAYACVLSRVEVSLAAPATNAVFYLATFAVAAVWLGEHVTVTRGAAVLMLLAAMWLLSRSA